MKNDFIDIIIIILLIMLFAFFIYIDIKIIINIIHKIKIVFNVKYFLILNYIVFPGIGIIIGCLWRNINE